jgi:hypothetical protein
VSLGEPGERAVNKVRVCRGIRSRKGEGAGVWAMVNNSQRPGGRRNGLLISAR